jgi:hypothetical protein
MPSEPRASVRTVRRPQVGYLDPDVAASVSQLAGGPAGRVRLNGREILASTTRIVGATWGETHRHVLIALTMFYVESGRDGIAEASLTKLARLIYGSGAGGEAYRLIARAAHDLFRGELTIEGFDVTTGQPTPGVYSRTRLLIDLVWNEDLERIFEGKLRGRDGIGQRIGGARGQSTMRWRFHPAYAERIQTAEVVSLDWDRLRSLHGVAQSLWIQLAAPRFQFTPLLERPQFEGLELLLDESAYQAFGIHASQDRDRRRTLNRAGERIMNADPAYERFEAHAAKSAPGRLVVVRRAGAGSRNPGIAEQLVLSPASFHEAA